MNGVLGREVGRARFQLVGLIFCRFSMAMTLVYCEVNKKSVFEIRRPLIRI